MLYLNLHTNAAHQMAFQKILVDDIVYIRRENRKVILRTREGKEYVTRRDLNQWMEELPNTFFYLVHKSFLVNLHYITKNSYSNIVLDNTIEIPVASRKQINICFIYILQCFI